MNSKNNTIIKRSLSPFIKEFFTEKIILLSGPRQVGKTFLSKNIVAKDHYYYLNYDNEDLRREIKEKSWPRDFDLIIFDEIHKMTKWKQWLKGIYDVEGIPPRLLVTGSSRLDTFRKVGDSLAGRHFNLRLLPLSVREIVEHEHCDEQDALEHLLQFGGFPEPFLKGTDRFARLWRKGHLDIILRQDLIELERVRELKGIELLVQLLAERVGSEINYTHLSRDLQVSDQTVKKWISILESFYVIFTVTPYSKNIAKAIIKLPKVYFYDLGHVKNESARLENSVALHLLKRNYFVEDTDGRKLGLHYIRDKEKREIDFCLTENQNVTHLIEVKESDSNVTSSLYYYHQKFPNAKALQLLRSIERRRQVDLIQVEPVAKFLLNLET